MQSQALTAAFVVLVWDCYAGYAVKKCLQRLACPEPQDDNELSLINYSERCV